ncbi:MAG: DinB family protein [Planctomycetes bacterium]|nr:DinB family protein [Planctomycetota bacterium]
MGALLPWTQRTFRFDFPVEIYPDVIERLRGLAPRVAAKVRAATPSVLTRREREGTWSIQENIGHLLDLEPLGFTRLDEYLNGVERLSPADMTNKATSEAAHNDRSIEALLAELTDERGRFVARLDSLAPADFARSAVHPRLKVPMRMVDWLSFVAAHDDYHLARMTELLRMFGCAAL